MVTKLTAPPITFSARLVTVGTRTIVQIPQRFSDKLPSRGQVMVEGVLAGQPFKTPLEPDGRFGHWFSPDTKLLSNAGVNVGDSLEISMSPTKDWPEPAVPADLRQAIMASVDTKALWEEITPMARWEWVRWTRSTGNTETRKHRIEVACSKMKAGERRPCCWNRNLCTVPEVSKSGRLLDPQ